MAPFITITMPVYNVAKYVKRALLSALNQTYENFEIIIVDDRGKDNSMDIVRNLVLNHPRGKKVRIIEHEKNKGTGAARNTAIDNASGEYIYFMDSDDEISVESIGILVKSIIEEGPVDVCAGSATYISQISKEFVGYDKHLYLKGNQCVWSHFHNTDSIFSTPIWNKLYKTTFLRRNKIRCVPRQLNEDAWFTFQVMLNANSCILDPSPIYRYYINEGSTCDHRNSTPERRKFMTQQYTEICKLKKRYIKPFSVNSNYPELLEDVMKDCEGHCLSVIYANTAYLLKEGDGYIKRKFRILGSLLVNRQLKDAISSMLTYPEDDNFISGLSRERYNIHKRYYTLSKSSDIKKIWHIVYGILTHRIAIR